MRKDKKSKAKPYDKREHSTDEVQEIAENLVIGRNPVKEVLKTDRQIEKILVAVEDDRAIADILTLAQKKKIIIQKSDKRKLDRLCVGGIHQGVVALTTPYNYYALNEMVEEISQETENPLIIILDQITDPHNYGAILRVAECCGVNGIIVGKHRAATLSPIAIKASAGASEHVRIAKVTNISDTIRILKDKGYWIGGADMAGETMTACNLMGALAIVIGSEGKGITANVRKQCDFFVSIPMKGQINSLNASVAAAVILYEAVRQRG